MNKIKITKDYTQMYNYDNNWKYKFTRNILNNKIRKYGHFLINPDNEEIPIVSKFSEKRILTDEQIDLEIYNAIGYVYKTDYWKYFIKILDNFELNHFIEKNGIVQKIPYFKCHLMPDQLLLNWARFHFISPEYTGNKTITQSMMMTLEKALKKCGKSINYNPTEEDMKKIEMILVIKKLTQ